MGKPSLRYVPPPEHSPQGVTGENYEQFVRLLVKYERRVHAYILSLVPNFADSEELLQETYVRLYEQKDNWDATRDFLPWACTIAHYQVLTHRRQLQREKLRFSQEFVDSVAEEIERQGDELDDRQIALNGCLDKLSPSARHMIQIAYSGKLKTAQIAQQVDRSVAATYKALSRIRQTLHDCIESTLRGAHHT